MMMRMRLGPMGFVTKDTYMMMRKIPGVGWASTEDTYMRRRPGRMGFVPEDTKMMIRRRPGQRLSTVLVPALGSWGKHS